MTTVEIRPFTPESDRVDEVVAYDARLTIYRADAATLHITVATEQETRRLVMSVKPPATLTLNDDYTENLRSDGNILLESPASFLHI